VINVPFFLIGPRPRPLNSTKEMSSMGSWAEAYIHWGLGFKIATFIAICLN